MMARGAAAERRNKDMQTQDLSVHVNILPCLHRHVVLTTTGGMHFSEGEVCDDIEEHLLCLDCLEYVDEEEVRARWNGTDQLPF